MASVKLKSPLQLVVRCLAQPLPDGQWQAFTLEFGLAAQGDSLREVRQKLDRMIQTYLHDALVGEDREHAYELLRRRAPLQMYLWWYLGGLVAKLRGYRHSQVKSYHESLGLEPKHCPL